MGFIYYGYAFPLSLRIERGFYDTGVWSNKGLVPYGRIGGLSWQEGTEPRLVLIDRVRSLARHLDVPQEHYGEVRRLLRDKIAAQDIRFEGKGLDLGFDERKWCDAAEAVAPPTGRPAGSRSCAAPGPGLLAQPLENDADQPGAAGRGVAIQSGG